MVRFGIPSIFVASVTVVLTVVAAVAAAPLAALPMLLGVPIYWLSTRRYLRLCRQGLPVGAGHLRPPQRRRLRDRRRGPHHRRPVAGPGAPPPVRRGAARLLRRRALHARLRLRSGSRRSSSPTCCLSPAPCCGAAAGLDRPVSVGTATAVVLYVQQMIGPLDDVLMWLDEIQVGATSLARVIGIADVPPDREATGETPRGNDLASTTCTTPTARARRPATASRSTSRPASGWPSSAPRAPASRPWAGCSPGSTDRVPGR